MNLHLSGRRAIVTGAAQGIGLSIVQAFVTEGMQVAAFDIDGTGLQAARAAGVRPYGRERHPVAPRLASPLRSDLRRIQRC